MVSFFQPRLRRSRSAALIAFLLTLTFSGCASVTSPADWFSNRYSAKAPNASGSGLVTNLADTGKGISGQFKSMGTAVSSAMGKARTAVTSSFTPRTSEDDATSLASMPQNVGPEIWVANGHLFESQNNYAKALDNYTKALEVEPTNLSALLSTARLYAKQQKHEQAAEFFQKALEVQPEASTYNELAMAQLEFGRSAEAQATVKKAIDMDPSNVRYRNSLASIMVAEGRSDEAVQQLEQVFPPAVANYNVAYMHFTNRNVAAAQQHLQQALQQDPNLEPARQLLAQLNGNPTTQAARQAFDTASQVYRTTDGLLNGSVPSQTVPYPKSNETTPPVRQ